jgi:hypothetical protein
MRYSKPELVPLPSAVDAVQMQDKYSDPHTDSGNVKRFTTNAYEADE